MLTSQYSHRFRSQHYQKQRTPTEKLVCFEIGGEWYGIAIGKVLRVIKDFVPHGCLQGQRSLVESNGELIPTLDPTILFNTLPDPRSPEYLIICTFSDPHHSDRLGIPIPQMPTILEVSPAQFEAVPSLYRQGLTGGELAPAALEKIVRPPDGKIIFYLNIEKFSLDRGAVAPES